MSVPENRTGEWTEGAPRQMYKKQSKRKKRWMVERHEENGRYTRKKEEDRSENGHAPSAQPDAKHNQTKSVRAHMYVWCFGSKFGCLCLSI